MIRYLLSVQFMANFGRLLTYILLWVVVVLNCKNSKLENTIYEMLTEANIKFEYRKRSLEWLESLELDFYIPELKIAIECQGLQHFQPVDFSGKGEEWAKQQFDKAIERDNRKRILCAK